MGSGLLNPDMEGLLEGVLLLSLTASGLCMLALVALMVRGRWQHEVRQREKKRRRNL